MNMNENEIRWLLEDKGRISFQLRPGRAKVCPEPSPRFNRERDGATTTKPWGLFISSNSSALAAKSLLFNKEIERDLKNETIFQ